MKKPADGKESLRNQGRRRLLKSLAVGGGAMSAAKVVPEAWVKPVVDSVVLPAHSQTSPGGDPTPGGNPLGQFRSGIQVVDVLPAGPDELIVEESISEELLEFFMPSAHAQSCFPGNCSVELNMEVTNASAFICMSGQLNGANSFSVDLNANPPRIGSNSLLPNFDVLGGDYANPNWHLRIAHFNTSTEILMTPGGTGCPR